MDYPEIILTDWERGVQFGHGGAQSVTFSVWFDSGNHGGLPVESQPSEADIKVTFYIPLDVELAGDNIEVIWPEGVLQTLEDISGTWSDVPDATSPYLVDTTRPQQFFRVKSE